MTSPGMRESTFEKWKSYNRAQSLLLGPCFVPNRWFLFPMKNSWKERRFREVLLTINCPTYWKLYCYNVKKGSLNKYGL